MREYVAKNHRWIIGTLIAVVIPLVIYSLQKSDTEKFETKTYYYTNSNNGSNTSDLKKADCWITSLSSNRSDAFRCSVGNGIYDPCFEDPIGDESIISCPSEPYEEDPMMFKMISRPHFDKETEKTDAVPWYIILKNKQTCRFITGATTTIANRRLDYGCNEGTYDSLYLPLKENDEELQIGCTVGNRMEFCSIQEAWY